MSLPPLSESEIAPYVVKNYEVKSLVLRSTAATMHRRGLQCLGDSLREWLQNPQDENPECSPTAGFDGQSIQPDLPNAPLRQFIGYVCSANNWGGILTTKRRSLKEAVSEATPEDVKPYNPAEPCPEHAGQSLFGLLRAFDADLPIGVTFSDPLDRLISTRNKLVAEA